MGTILFIAGCINWSSQQKIIDKIKLIECKQAIYEWEKKSQIEKQVEVEREMHNNDHIKTELSAEEIRTKEEEIRKEKEEIRKQIVRKYDDVEKDVIDAINRNLGDKFKVYKNTRIGGLNTNYDAIAESILDEQDYIFEVRYVRSANSWNAHMWKMLPDAMRGFVETYEHKTKRKAKPVLLIVVAENQVEQANKVKKDARRHWATETDIIVNVFTEANIDTLTKADIIENGIL